MSDAIYDPYAYTRLTDSVFQQIIMSNDPNLQEVSANILSTSAVLGTKSIPCGLKV